MATKTTTQYTNQTTRNTSLHVDQSLRDIQTTLVNVRGSYTCDGTEANSDIIKLCLPRITGYLVPEISRVGNRGASAGDGDCDLDLALRKVDTSGTATAIAVAASIDNNFVALGRLTTAPVLVEASDELDFLVSNRDASASGQIIDYDLVFACVQHS